MPTKGDYHEDEGLKDFILTNYSVDKDTGRVRRNGRKPRDKKPNIKGEYRRMEVNGVTMPTARVIVLLMTGDWPEGVVGYRNGNPMDLRPDNLIVLSQEDNHRRRYAERGGKMPPPKKTKEELKLESKKKYSWKENGYKGEADEELKQFILQNYSYVKETGVIVKGIAPDDPFADVSRKIVGKAKKVSPRKQRVLRTQGFRFLYARVAFLLVNGDWPTKKIVHRNGNLWDTRWSNLIVNGGE